MLAEEDVRGFLAGDPDAVREVYREYGRLVFAVAFKVLGDRDLAEEATQQTFVRAWRSARSFDPARDMAPWLATIARRVAIDLHRREARRSHERLDEFNSQPGVVTLPDTAETVYQVWEVRRAVADLPPDERDVVRLQHMEGLTHTEIAARLKVPPGTVKSRSFRAHRHLAARLGHLREDLG